MKKKDFASNYSSALCTVSQFENLLDCSVSTQKYSPKE